MRLKIRTDEGTWQEIDLPKGDKGDPGEDGKNGKPGKDGKDGLSAYELWLAAGHKGSVKDFLNSLKGPKGDRGRGGGGGLLSITTGGFGAWADFVPIFTWGTADPTITTQICRYVKSGTVVFFNVYLLISDGKGTSSLTISLPSVAPQIANYKLYLQGYKNLSGIRSNPYPYIDYNIATPLVKFDAFGTLPNTKTAELNINGQYEVSP
jgi:hypothetical protein